MKEVKTNNQPFMLSNMMKAFRGKVWDDVLQLPTIRPREVSARCSEVGHITISTRGGAPRGFREGIHPLQGKCQRPT